MASWLPRLARLAQLTTFKLLLVLKGTVDALKCCKYWTKEPSILPQFTMVSSLSM